MSGSEAEDGRNPALPEAIEWGTAAMAGLIGASLSGQPIAGLVPLLTPFMKTAWRLDQRSWGRRSVRAARALQTAANHSGNDVTGLYAQAVSSDARSELLARVLDASAHTVNLDGKVEALGKVLAMGLWDDGRFDEALLLAAALQEIEGPHARILVRLADSPVPPYVVEDPAALTGWSFDHLCAHFPGFVHVMPNLVNVLERHALVRDNAYGTWGFAASLWMVTPLGEQMIHLLRHEEDA